jgi:hypothetical protein
MNFRLNRRVQKCVDLVYPINSRWNSDYCLVMLYYIMIIILLLLYYYAYNYIIIKL